jgi:hypothetical protein
LTVRIFPSTIFLLIYGHLLFSISSASLDISTIEGIQSLPPRIGNILPILLTHYMLGNLNCSSLYLIYILYIYILRFFLPYKRRGTLNKEWM